MAVKEVDLLGEAIAGTEAEIFGEAVNGTEVETGDESEADRSLETMDEDETSDADEGEEGDAAGEEGEGDEPEADAKPNRDDKTGKFAAKDDASPDAKPEGDDKGKGRSGDPTIALRDERQQRQVLKAELDKEREERAKERESFKTDFAKLEGRLDQVLRAQPQPAAPKADAPKPEKPDKFVDPEGYDKWVEDQIAQSRTEAEKAFTERFINASMADAHEKHQEKFEAAFEAAKKLDRSNPANVAVLRSIREAPNPGAKLMRWYGEQETLREVGSDPAAFKQKIADETRAALIKDPEFRKQLLADMQAEARGGSNGGNNGKPRTVIRTPPSLNGAAGRGESQLDPRTYDNSERTVFESAFE